jgi:arginine/ornithine transport system permease protein
MNFDLVVKHWDLFVGGIWVTIHLTALALFFGMLIALPASLSLARKSRFSPLVGAYVYVFRGTPLLVQTYLIYYGLSQFDFVREGWFWRPPAFLPEICFSYPWPANDPVAGVTFKLRGACAADLWPSLREAWWCAMIAFSLNSGAYTAEILRGAIATTPKGEIEGARSIGLSERQITWLVLLPSAMRRALPQYGNEVVFMLHGSVVASIITIQDILGVGRTVNAKYYIAYEGILTAAALYMIITYLLVRLFRMIEDRYLKHLNIDAGKARTLPGEVEGIPVMH